MSDEEKVHFMHARHAAKRPDGCASAPPRSPPFPDFIMFGDGKGRPLAVASLVMLHAYEKNLVEPLAPGVREYRRESNVRNLRAVRRELGRRRIASVSATSHSNGARR